MTRSTILRRAASALGAIAAVACLLAAAGCATAPSAGADVRIQRNQAFFDSLPLAAQARIRGGQTDIGFTADMTRLALGEPHARFVRRDAAGEREVWLYYGVEHRYERCSIDFIGIHDSRNRLPPNANVGLSVPYERTVARVEFERGLVVAVETAVAE